MAKHMLTSREQVEQAHQVEPLELQVQVAVLETLETEILGIAAAALGLLDRLVKPPTILPEDPLAIVRRRRYLLTQTEIRREFLAGSVCSAGVGVQWQLSPLMYVRTFLRKT